MGNINTSSRDIFLNYLKSGFLVDVVASMPVGIIEIIISGINKRLLNLLKTPRLLRVGRIMKYLENARYANFIRIMRLYVILFMVAHWVGCFYFFILNDP